MLIEKIAQSLLKRILLEVAGAEKEHTVQLVKKPGEKGCKHFNVKVSFGCPKSAIPVYVDRIVAAAADTTGVSFDEMLKHTGTTHIIMKEITEEVKQ